MKKDILHRLALLAMDGLVYLAAFSLTNCIFYSLSWEDNLYSMAEAGGLYNIALPLVIILFSFINRRLYSLKPYLFWDELHRIVKALIMAFLIIFFLLYLVRIDRIRSTVTFSLIIFLFLDPAVRYFYRIFMVRLGWLRTNVVIIGSGAQGQRFHDTVREHRFTTYNVKGYVDEAPQDSWEGKQYLGTLEELEEIIDRTKADEVVVAIPKATRDDLQKIMKQVEMKVKTIRFIPDMYGVLTFSPEITDFDRVLTISAPQGLLRFSSQMIKRIVDLLLSAVGLLILAPLSLIAGILIKLEDGGPVFFIQNRLGKDGRPIKIFKFRTMLQNAEEILRDMMEKDPALRDSYEQNKKLDPDPRITKVGAFLRKSSLDEFPQFINIVRGEMSVVGPRPYLFNEIKDMQDKYDSIIKIKPGLTGLWQATGRNDIGFSERVVLDQYYVRNWTVWFDLVILMKTVVSVLYRRGARG